jgi:hypothetical protein
MTTMFAKVMKELADAFVTDKRNDGKTFYKLKDGVNDNGVPDWLSGDAGSKVMREIHSALDSRLPDDWVYEAVSSIADAFESNGVDNEDDAREQAHEIADGLVDVYNSDRLKWLATHLLNVDIVDEACKELGTADDAGIIDRIGVGQYYAYERLANAVIEAVKDEAEGRDEDEEAA